MRRSPASSPRSSGSSPLSGSVRATWLWLRAAGPALAAAARRVYLHGNGRPEITWVEPTYHAVHTTLTHPAYAGAYVYGRTRKTNATLAPDGALRTAAPQAAPRPVGGPHPRSPPRVHRLGHLPGQPGPHRRQHPPAGQPAGHRRGPGRLRAAAGPGHLRHLRPQAGHLLPRPGQIRAELLLPGPGRPGRRPRRPAHERRRAGHRRRRRRRVPGRARTRRAAGLPARRPAARRRPRRRARPSTAARSSRPATTPPGPSAATGPSTRTTGWSPAAWKPNGSTRCASSPTPRPSSPAARPPAPRPSPGTNGPRSSPSATTSAQVWDAADHHRQGPQAAAAHPARRGEHHAAPRRPQPARLPWCCGGKAARSAS